MQEKAELYKQEGKFHLFQMMRPALACTGKLIKSYLPVSYGELYFHVKDEFGQVYMTEKGMEGVAKAFLSLAQNSFPNGWKEEWLETEEEMSLILQKINKLNLQTLTLEELRNWYQKLFQVDEKMWAISIFIDVFDAGYDQKEIQKIAEKNNLTSDEVVILLTPQKLSYLTEWHQDLLKLKRGGITEDALRDKFFWFRTDYVDSHELDNSFIQKELDVVIDEKLENSLMQEKEILIKHSLESNPLLTFKILSEWRDERKRLNFMSLYGLIKILREVFKRLKIDSKLVSFLLPGEINTLFSGKIYEDDLRNRLDLGVFVSLKDDNLEVLQGQAGEEKRLALEKKLNLKVDSSVAEIKGMVASRGFVKAKVQIIRQATSEAQNIFKEGSVLVTSMTRPEFLPLMKKASAIITDEGGISCHAAIVSRELKKPCIIGTKNATRVLKDGDMVEVDANNGIVMILK